MKFRYCTYQIENGGKGCTIQCKLCKAYFEPLEKLYRRVPRKIKKK